MCTKESNKTSAYSNERLKTLNLPSLLYRRTKADMIIHNDLDIDLSQFFHLLFQLLPGVTIMTLQASLETC